MLSYDEVCDKLFVFFFWLGCYRSTLIVVFLHQLKKIKLLQNAQVSRLMLRSVILIVFFSHVEYRYLKIASHVLADGSFASWHSQKRLRSFQDRHRAGHFSLERGATFDASTHYFGNSTRSCKLWPNKSMLLLLYKKGWPSNYRLPWVINLVRKLGFARTWLPMRRILLSSFFWLLHFCSSPRWSWFCKNKTLKF